MAVLVSACLLGLNCRYDGGAKLDRQLLDKLADECVLPVCPEQLGGLSTPRPPAEMVRGSGQDVLRGCARILNEQGEDVTQNYIRGARQVVELARLFGVQRAILKELSPACGVKYIKRKGRTIPGMGVTAAALAEMGIELVAV